MTADLDCSVIVSSYNHPNCLRLVLEGFARQDSAGFEMIIADDGSARDTFELIERFAQRAPFPLRVVKQRDEGFRKARIVNTAALIARGQQLLFTDGDCVPFPNFVRIHRTHYASMGYLVGGYVHLTLDESRALTVEDVAQGEHQRFLTARLRCHLRSVHHRNQLYRVLRKPRRPKILGGNFSVSRDAFVGVNGFDERFVGLGGEDTDLRNRLNNLGARSQSLWNLAFTCHLDHGLDPRRCQSGVVRARRDRSFSIVNRSLVRTPFGLAERELDELDSSDLISFDTVS